LKDKGVNGKIILKWTINNLDGRTWTGFNWLNIGTSGNKPLSSINYGMFLA
jgi:hypothetical protein